MQFFLCPQDEAAEKRLGFRLLDHTHVVHFGEPIMCPHCGGLVKQTGPQTEFHGKPVSLEEAKEAIAVASVSLSLKRTRDKIPFLTLFFEGGKLDNSVNRHSYKGSRRQALRAAERFGFTLGANLLAFAMLDE